MEITEYLKYRKQLIVESQDENEFFSPTGFLTTVMPSMLDSKVIESEDFNESYYSFADSSLKLIGYSINESGERLVVYLVNEDSLTDKDDEALLISQKAFYDGFFTKGLRFITSAIKGEFNNILQDADGINFLANQLSSDEGINNFDVVELFLVSATATVETRGSLPQSKSIEFEEDFVKVKYRREKTRLEKEIKVIKRLIDLNFLHSVLVSQGNREPLTIDFEKSYNIKIEAIKVADEQFFESYLCVIPGEVLANLYRDHSSRLLEKNVRSFLQFSNKSVNSGIKNTIIDEPEKFIAYNNGLTITATGKEIFDTGGRIYIKSLTDFQIVNGGQTTATIFFSRKDRISVERVRVMAKVNIAKESTEEELDELISNISKYSNAQNRVSKVDLHARSKPMLKLKSLSDSIVTPKGLRWFFERSKGELKTIIKKSGNKDGILRKYPKERQFTKEELAKFYTAWGNTPYSVKKGGEKVFREFIEEISGEGKSKAAIIDRHFYENAIARITLFRGLEKLYANAKIGHLRSAVIPYSLSILYNYIGEGANKDRYFNFEKIWIDENIGEDLSGFLLELMILMNDLIKKYAHDDPNENSKTKELWEKISICEEIIKFIANSNTKKIIKNYTISKEDYKLKVEKYRNKEVSFLNLQENIFIHNNGIGFYNKIKSSFHSFTSREKEYLNCIIDGVYKKADLDSFQIEQERLIINKIIASMPTLFDVIELSTDNYYQETFDYIVEIYNSNVLSKKSILTSFQEIQSKAEINGIKNSNVWGEIGKGLELGVPPTFSQLFMASALITGAKGNIKKGVSPVVDEKLIKNMIEWGSKHKCLSSSEINYLTDFAYSLKKINSFHEGNIRRYLEKMNQKGFKH